MLVSLLLISTITLDQTHAKALKKRVPTSIQEANKPQKKIKKLTAAQKAAQAYAKKNWQLTLQLAKKIESQENYGDLSIYLQAEAAQALATQQIKKKNLGEALANAQESIKQNLRLLELFPESPYVMGYDERVGIAELLVAQIYGTQKKLPQARVFFHRSFERIKDSKLPALVTFNNFKLYAQSCAKSKEPKCTEWIRKFADSYPKESLERKYISENLTSFLDATASNPYYDRLSRNYKAPDPDQVAFDEILPLILKEDHKALIEKGQKFLETYPKTTYRVRTLYWMAVAYMARDYRDKATPLFEQIIKESPISYYGILSANALGKDPDSYFKKDNPPASQDDMLLSSDEKKSIQRAAELSQAGATELAKQELKLIDMKKNFSNSFLVYLAQETCNNQSYASCYRILTELNQRGFTDVYTEASLDLYFPNVFQDLIQQTSQEFSTDPILIQSLIKQESAFNSEAVSNVGAMGLMQLMPFTAVAVDAKIEQAAVTEPKTNIKLGTQYLAELIKKFNGNWVYALAGYNAGPHRVDKWMKDGGSKLGMTAFIESIPYKETRDYVSTIMRNYYWYTYRRTGKKLKTLDVFWGKLPETKTDTKPQNGSA